MNCREVTEFLADYLDGSLPWRQRLLFRMHLLVCGHCRRFLASYRRTIRMTKESSHPVKPASGMVSQVEASAALESPPEELIQAILATRRAETRVTPAPRRHPTGDGG